MTLLIHRLRKILGIVLLQLLHIHEQLCPCTLVAGRIEVCPKPFYRSSRHGKRVQHVMANHCPKVVQERSLGNLILRDSRGAPRVPLLRQTAVKAFSLASLSQVLSFCISKW